MTWLADPPASNAQAGPLGLLVVILLAIATFLLVRSMSRHLRKVPASFDGGTAAPPGSGAGAGAGPAAPAEMGTAAPAEDLLDEVVPDAASPVEEQPRSSS
jgi:hypothetical protein